MENIQNVVNKEKQNKYKLQKLNNNLINSINVNNLSNDNPIFFRNTRLTDFYNSSLGLYDVIPQSLDSKYKTKNKDVFLKLSTLFIINTNEIIRRLLQNNKLPYYHILQTLINREDDNNLVYSTKGNNNISNDLEFDLDYEQDNTIYRCDRFRKSLNNFNTNLGQIIIDFLKPENRSDVYIGGIKLGPKFKLLTKIFGSKKIESHLNSFIIDKKHKQIIHFEPRGAKSILHNWCSVNVLEYIFKSIEETNYTYSFQTIQELKTYKFIVTNNLFNKYFMPQGLLFDILCQTYVIYASILYCLNFDNLKYMTNPLLLFSKMSQDKAIIFQNLFYTEMLPKFFSTMSSNNIGKYRIITNVFNNNTGSKKINKTAKKTKKIQPNINTYFTNNQQKKNNNRKNKQLKTFMKYSNILNNAKKK